MSMPATRILHPMATDCRADARRGAGRTAVAEPGDQGARLRAFAGESLQQRLGEKDGANRSAETLAGVPGHEIIGRVVKTGKDATKYQQSAFLRRVHQGV